MIELNLLPKELRRKRKKRKGAELPKIPMLPIAVGIIVVLLFTHLGLMILARGNRKLAEELATKWDEMKPQRDKTDDIAKEINALQKRIDAIRKIAKPDLDWARLLGGLNQAIISNIWLSEFSISTRKQQRGKEQVEETPLSLDLTGYALGKSEIAMSTVGRFMESLKKNKNFFGYFKEIELQNIRNAMISGQEVMMFKLICKFEGVESSVAEKPKKKVRRRKR